VREIHVDELPDMVGQTLGVSPWRRVDQARIDLFADATDDHQWIHVDPERAASGPFGTTVAHGYLTISLLPALVGSVLTFTGVRSRLNYGLERVRFPAPLLVDGDVRAQVDLLGVVPVTGGAQVELEVTVEVEGGDRPVCVAHTLTRLLV
jgi:acyl dehydratase